MNNSYPGCTVLLGRRVEKNLAGSKVGRYSTERANERYLRRFLTSDHVRFDFSAGLGGIKLFGGKCIFVLAIEFRM